MWASRRIWLFAGSLAGLGLLGVTAVCQEKTAKTQSTLEVNPPGRDAQSLTVQSDERKTSDAFEKAFTDYREAIREIEELRIEYQAASVDRRKKINADLLGRLANGKKLVQAMVEAAKEAYRVAPNADPRTTELLTDMVKHYVVGQQIGPGEPASSDPENQYIPIFGGDQYELALPIVKLLIDGGTTDKNLYVWGFLAAFMTNEYDLASEYLKKAQELKALEALVAEAKDEQHNREAGLSGMVYRHVMNYSGQIDKYRALWVKEAAIRAAEEKANDLPRVKFTTTKGDITLELFENDAPQTVANFLTLVKLGFYDGSPFHRVLPMFMAQGGAKSDDGQGGPGYTIRCECYTPEYRHHFRGSLSMAHRGRDTGSSQFFLTFVPTTHLDGRHTVFGRVIEGIEVLGELQRRSPQQQEELPKPDRITKAVVLRDRGHKYDFEKLAE